MKVTIRKEKKGEKRQENKWEQDRLDRAQLLETHSTNSELSSLIASIKHVQKVI